ncbi:MAG: TIGR00730 family Rossman fold protein [Candidatus Nucleicultricaceae bacterium]
MSTIQSVCVYCGSSNNTKEIYRESAKDLGAILATNNIKLVYGGAKVGLMGILAESALNHNGYVLGFMTEFLDEYEGANYHITELHVVSTMHERKQKMFENSDAFLILPGGFGTLDEVFEMLTWKQVGLHKKGIFFLNINNYWRPLFDNFVQHMIDNGFVRESDKNLFHIVDDLSELIPIMQNYPAHEDKLVSKFS